MGSNPSALRPRKMGGRSAVNGRPELSPRWLHGLRRPNARRFHRERGLRRRVVGRCVAIPCLHLAPGVRRSQGSTALPGRRLTPTGTRYNTALPGMCVVLGRNRYDTALPGLCVILGRNRYNTALPGMCVILGGIKWNTALPGMSTFRRQGLRVHVGSIR